MSKSWASWGKSMKNVRNVFLYTSFPCKWSNIIKVVKFDIKVIYKVLLLNILLLFAKMYWNVFQRSGFNLGRERPRIMEKIICLEQRQVCHCFTSSKFVMGTKKCTQFCSLGPNFTEIDHSISLIIAPTGNDSICSWDCT